MASTAHRVPGARLAVLCVVLILVLAIRLRTRTATFDPSAGSDAAALPTLLDVTDVDGAVHEVGHGASPTVLVFLATECPISNQYHGTLNALAERYSAAGVHVYGVLSDPSVTRVAAKMYGATHDIRYSLLFDASGILAQQFAPTRTPEALLLGRDGRVAYRGLIDDSFYDRGKRREGPPHRFLEEALVALIQGKPVPTPQTKPVGCVFESWESGALPAKVTYARDVAPILNAHCVICHCPDALGPFPLTSFADARKRARTIAEVTRDRLMPPWQAVAGFGQFEHEATLTSRELGILAAWAESGAAPGNPEDLPAAPVFSSEWQFGPPDLVVEMSRGYPVPAEGKDLYVNFVVGSLPADVTLSGWEIRPGAPTVVHHLGMATTTAGTQRALEASAGGFGYRPAPGKDGTMEPLTVWAGGVQAMRFPDDAGVLLEKGTDLVMQLHYRPSGRAEADRSRMGLYFAKKPVHRFVRHFSIRQFPDIPAGDAAWRTSRSVTLPVPVTVFAARPHMHLLAQEMRVAALLPGQDGQAGPEIPIVWVKSFDPFWQPYYVPVESRPPARRHPARARGALRQLVGQPQESEQSAAAGPLRLGADRRDVVLATCR